MDCPWRAFVKLFIILSAAHCISSDVDFPKDTRTEHHTFPPRITGRKDKHIPIGHLRPFGFQKKPDGPVVEYKDALHPERFWKEHVSLKVPCVYRGDMNEAPALEKWTDDYLKKNYGDLDVLVEVKKEDRTVSPKRMSLKTFLAGYLKEDWYIVSVLPDEMRGEVKASKSFLCGTFAKTIQETNLWMSSGDTASVIHYDADHNLHCLLSGRKDFVMIEPMFADHLYMTEKSPFVGSGYSEIDVDMINMFQHGSVSKVRWTWTTLRPGDCLYIPAGYLHQVRSYGRSISTTTLFTSYPEFDKSDCEGKEFEYTDMSQVQVMWTYKKGDKVIEIGYLNVDSLRQNLLSILGENDILYIERFAPYFNHLKYDIDPEVAEKYGVSKEVRETFYKMDTTKKNHLTREDIDNLNLEQLKDFARVVDVPTVPPKEDIVDKEVVEVVEKDEVPVQEETVVKEDEQDRKLKEEEGADGDVVDESEDEEQYRKEISKEDYEEEAGEREDEHDHHDHDEL